MKQQQPRDAWLSDQRERESQIRAITKNVTHCDQPVAPHTHARTDLRGVALKALRPRTQHGLHGGHRVGRPVALQVLQDAEDERLVVELVYTRARARARVCVCVCVEGSTLHT